MGEVSQGMFLASSLVSVILMFLVMSFHSGREQDVPLVSVQPRCVVKAVRIRGENVQSCSK